MAKLHELLAVHSSLATQAEKTRTDLTHTFETKVQRFGEKRVVYTPDKEGAQETVEVQASLQSTVNGELVWIKKILAKYWNSEFQIADSNTKAKADILLDDGTILAKDIPATALLDLEKRLAELQVLFKSIPTLDPTKGFEKDPQRKNAYKAREVTKKRTELQKQILIKYEATDKHPAQTEVYDKQVPIGTISEKEWSGLITPAESADLNSRLDDVLRAVKKARARANEQEVDLTKKVADSLFDHILGKDFDKS
jgi:hypothetical protein